MYDRCLSLHPQYTIFLVAAGKFIFARNLMELKKFLYYHSAIPTTNIITAVAKNNAPIVVILIPVFFPSLSKNACQKNPPDWNMMPKASIMQARCFVCIE